MEFEWDPNKDVENIRKHGFGFREAVEVFDRPHLTKPDTQFRYNEIREITTGYVPDLDEIVVVHTDVVGAVRIISARTATKREKKEYYEYCASQT